ncbi:MAG: Hemolysin [Candidatus Electronema aureum]|uniref:Hemolysin n=1 Tax=Candidatus Electronema aureum TaxID=2005002 RepID=A0A521FYL8_9BACT|nr:MAG: Hemolysin [Candidatus Electronema aureum]
MLLELVLACGLSILMSACCSLLEAALYSLPLSRIEMMAEEHPSAATVLRKLKSNIDQPIAAILTLNTIANTMGAAVAGAAAAAVFGEDMLIWFSAFFTLVILLFSEILPKTIGVAFNTSLAPYIAQPLQLMVFLLKPMIMIGQAVTHLVPKAAEYTVSAEELITIARLSRSSGEIGAEQEIVITNIIALRRKCVRQVMTPRTVTFTMNGDTTVAEAVRLEERLRVHSRVPVCGTDSDDVIGIVHSYEVMEALAIGNAQLRLAELMRPAHFVPEIAPLDKVMLEFFERRQHLFVAVDEYGGVTGVISLEDIIEEIIGREIMDESDRTGNLRAWARAQKNGAVTQEVE